VNRLRGIILVSFLAALLLMFGCVDTREIRIQNDKVLANMQSAQKLLDFQESGQLSSFSPNYQNHSDEIASACEELKTIDEGATHISKDAKAICENKRGLDDCFFQIEKIKSQIKNREPDINLDSLDVLCKDLRSMGLQDSLDGFEKKYKAYGAWIDAENDISAKWNELSAFFSNSSSASELNGAKMSDYYNTYKGGLAKAQASLEGIKGDCALKNDFKSTSNKTEKICSNLDNYLSDLEKTDSIILDTFNFMGQFESGTVTVDNLFIRECNQVSKEYSGLYDLKLMKDAAPDNNKTGLGAVCESFENLSIIYGGLGIPLILEDGELSSSTKNELFKAKTVYVETDTGLGSGVIISSDSSGSGYYILTNAHVALEYDYFTGSKYLPQYVRVKFYDERAGYADKLAYDQEAYDFVILHVPSSGNYPEASFDPSYVPRDGDKVVAVGNPYGLQFSVSQGTVSGRRDFGCLDDYCYGYMIQTDTSINPGNSGGGLWDYESGDLLGINSLGLSQAEGLNFAISMYQYDKIKDTFVWHDID